MPKFGFESEWQEGAADLTERLAALNLVGGGTMHQYHCRCNDCSFETSSYRLRVQTDSSCSGEVISSPFTSWADAVDTMTTLQTAALDVDAEPGMNAGFHVHVDMNEANTAQKANVLLGFVLWEPFLAEVAKGRFTSMRAMNTSARRRVRDYYGDYDYAEMNERSRAEMFSWYRSIDRHTNLNCRTNYGTFEFRVWNSTRSAWRMELFTRLSVALTNRNVAAALVANRPTFTPARDRLGYSARNGAVTDALTDENVTTFKAALRAGRQGATIDLLDRQLRYIADGRMTDVEFTAA